MAVCSPSFRKQGTLRQADMFPHENQKLAKTPSFLRKLLQFMERKAARISSSTSASGWSFRWAAIALRDSTCLNPSAISANSASPAGLGSSALGLGFPRGGQAHFILQFQDDAFRRLLAHPLGPSNAGNVSAHNRLLELLHGQGTQNGNRRCRARFRKHVQSAAGKYPFPHPWQNRTAPACSPGHAGRFSASALCREGDSACQTWTGAQSLHTPPHEHPGSTAGDMIPPPCRAEKLSYP